MSLTENRLARIQALDGAALIRYAVELAAVGALYVVVAKLSLSFASINPSATPIWPTTGYALAVVLLRRYRVVPAILAGAFIANLTTAGSLATSMGIAIGNTLESVICAYVLDRWSQGRNTFASPAGVVRFALTCFATGTIVSATLGVGTLALAGYANLVDVRSIWITWWIGDSAGALVITPAIVLWGAKPSPLADSNEFVQSALVHVAAIAVGLIAFSPMIGQTVIRTSLAFFAILPLLWAALRRGPRDTATTAMLLSAFAVWGTISGGGPFVRTSINESLLLLTAFMVSISVPSLALSADVAVRKRHEEHVNFVMHELSHRSKNLLSIVQSMANQVARQTDNFDDFKTGFTSRLKAFSDTHDLLIGGEWRSVDVGDLVRTHLVPFHGLNDGVVHAHGPAMKLGPKAAEQIGMALHELATNAAKHGAFSGLTGTVWIQWDCVAADDRTEYLRLTWKEMGGPAVTQPKREGFGTLVITKIVPAALGGQASLEFQSHGITWILEVARPNLA